MFAVAYQRTMANAKPKFRVPDEVVRSIEFIRREKREAAERIKREAAQAWVARLRAERDAARQRQEALQACNEYRTIDIRANSPTPARLIIERIAAFHDMGYERIVGSRRDRKSVEARFDAIEAVARARPDLSLPQLGRHFNRDHTTILYALRKRGVADRSQTKQSHAS